MCQLPAHLHFFIYASIFSLLRQRGVLIWKYICLLNVCHIMLADFGYDDAVAAGDAAAYQYDADEDVAAYDDDEDIILNHLSISHTGYLSIHLSVER